MTTNSRKTIIFGFVSDFTKITQELLTNDDYFWEGSKSNFDIFFPESKGLIGLTVKNITGSNCINGSLIKICTIDHLKRVVIEEPDYTPLNNSIYSTGIFINKYQLCLHFPLNRNPDIGWNLFEIHFKGLIYLMKNNFDTMAIKNYITSIDDKNIALFILMLHYFGVNNYVK
jgi:hypothetical protein